MRRHRQDEPGLERAVLITALAFVLVPVLIVPLAVPETRSGTGMLGVSGIVAYLTVLVADGLLYAHWRISSGPIGWLVLGCTALTVDALAVSGMLAADPAAMAARPNLMLLLEIAMAIGILTLVAVAPRHSLRIDPILAGAVIGLLVTLTRIALVSSAEPVQLSRLEHHALALLAVAIAVAIAIAIFRLMVGTVQLRRRLATAWLLLNFGHVVTYLYDPAAVVAGATVMAYVIGAALLLSLGIQLAWRSLQDQGADLDRTRRELEQVQADQRGDAARLHEIRATIAGLTSAARMVRNGVALPLERREAIEAMIGSEMDRLQRLLHSGHSAAATVVDLDAAIKPVVLRHQVRGFRVRWQPSGERVVARRDDVAEVINVLLENAFQHGGDSSRALIYTRHIDGVVEIAVADSGPGVDHSIRSHIFEWGGRSQSSGGSGIGLNVAQRLTVDLGGYLRLVDTPAVGATFVLGLPAEETM